MPTDKPKVIVYMPHQLHEALRAFQEENRISSASGALVSILSEYFGITHSVTHEVSYSALERIEVLETKIEALLRSKSLSNLSSDVPERSSNQLSKLPSKSRSKADSKSLSKVSHDNLSQRQLAERLRCDVRRLIDRRNNSTELAEYTRSKDPEGVSWGYREGKYYSLV